MVSFTAEIMKFGKKGEKTGWTYIIIPSRIANKLKPGNRKEFKVKGKFDKLSVERKSAMPMGDGTFIIPLNLKTRKNLRKKEGDSLAVKITEDKSEFIFNADFILCLETEPTAVEFFNTLPGSHQRYFSKWIEAAKTDATKAKRVAMALNALCRKMGFGEMLREKR